MEKKRIPTQRQAILRCCFYFLRRKEKEREREEAKIFPYTPQTQRHMVQEVYICVYGEDENKNEPPPVCVSPDSEGVCTVKKNLLPALNILVSISRSLCTRMYRIRSPCERRFHGETSPSSCPTSFMVKEEETERTRRNTRLHPDDEG